MINKKMFWVRERVSSLTELELLLLSNVLSDTSSGSLLWKASWRKQYLAFFQFKNNAVHGCDWDCLRHIIGNLTPNLQLRERDMLLVACHEQSIGKSSSLNTILPFLRVAGDPLGSLVTVLGICKILEYKTWKNHPETNTKLASHYTLQQHELSKESLLVIFITAWLLTVDHYHLLGKPIFNIKGFTFSIRITL